MGPGRRAAFGLRRTDRISNATIHTPHQGRAPKTRPLDRAGTLDARQTIGIKKSARAAQKMQDALRRDMGT